MTPITPQEPVFDPTYINLDYFFYKIYEFFGGGAGGDFSGFYAILSWIKFIFSILAVFFITLIIYCLIRIYEIKRDEHKKYHGLFAEPGDFAPAPKNQKWEQVKQHVLSENSSDWRLAIIEADTLLDELIKALNYKGENLGERMKNMSQNDFPKLQAAWEAHKVRNRIAHEGSDFVLTRPEARRIIDLYEEVFQSQNYI